MKQFNKLIIWFLISTNVNHLLADPYPVIINNNHNNNTNHFTLNVDFTQVSQGLSEAFKASRAYAAEQYKNSKKFAAQQYHNLNSWLKNHKCAILGAGAIVVYSGIMYQLNIGKKFLNNPDNWANWSTNTNLADLINKPTNLVCRELHQSILERYSHKEQFDALMPIILFNCDLNQEIKTLQTFYTLNQRLSKMRMQKLFFTSDCELEQAKDKLNRLIYLKKVINESIQVSLTK